MIYATWMCQSIFKLDIGWKKLVTTIRDWLTICRMARNWMHFEKLTKNMPHGEDLNAYWTYWKIKTKEKMLITFRIWSESSIDKSKYCNQAIGALLNRFFQCRWCIILNLDTLCSCVKCVNGKNKATTTWSAEPKVVPLNYNIRQQGGRIRQQ